MLSQPKVVFLQEKIMELQQALFFDLSSSVLKFPVSLIQALFVDEAGQVWFFLARPSQHLNEFDREFRSRLDFYKKGKNFYLHVMGKACIVSDPEEINCTPALPEAYREIATTGRAVLVRLKIQDIQYYPLRVAPPVVKPLIALTNLQPSALIKTLQYIVKDIIPVFQSH